MLPRHVAILRAKTGEFDALRNLDARIADKIRPLFEVRRITEDVLQRKYFQASATPVMAYLDRVLIGIASAWPSRPAMVDGYEWAPDARTETGEHVISYMVSHLRAAGMSIIPVVGYDRWGNVEYRSAVKIIPRPSDGHYCVRLDISAVQDAAEPEHFQSIIRDILDELDLDPARCSALIDFADVSVDAMSLDGLVSSASSLVHQLQQFGFHHYIVAGCSLPKTINMAIRNQDSVGAVLRKEMLVWQTLRAELPEANIVSGDYAVRGPTTTEARSKYTNGKIRYTIPKQMFVARGHPFISDGSYVQMHGLAAAVVRSGHFLGAGFSWGDAQIVFSQHSPRPGDLGRWIAIDTNHHLTFVVQEVEEFELSIAAKPSAKKVVKA